MRENLSIHRKRIFHEKAGKENRTDPVTPAFGVKTKCLPRAEDIERNGT